MTTQPADQAHAVARRTALRSGWITRKDRAVTALAVAAALLPAAALRGQLPEERDAAGPTPYSATVRDLNEGAQQIRVSLNHSVLIETSKPSERVQAIDPSIIFVQSVSPTQILVTGTGTGSSQVLVWSEEGEQQIFQVTVELDLAALNAALATVDPLSEVRAVPLMGNIVLVGTASGADMAQRMLEVAELFVPETGAGGQAAVRNHMMVAGEQQVLLRCTVAEIARSAARQLGINGFLAGENFQDGFVVNQLGGVNPINIGAQTAADIRQNMLFGTDGIPLSSTVPLSLGFPRVQMQLFIKALADNSLLRVLAEPNLVAVSGETASFLVGGEFPIPVPQGVDQITIEFREFGARLNFTPVVRQNDRIRMHIAPEVSELDFSTAVQVSGFSVPGLTQRRMESTVEVGNGQTLAIAGLLSDEVRGVASRVPGLGDVPVLGSLFRSVEYRRSVTELVILVTPEVVSPMNPRQVPKVPGEDHVSPSDFEVYALGMVEGRPAGPGPAAGGTPPVAVAGQSRQDASLAGASPEVMNLHGPWGHAGESDY